VARLTTTVGAYVGVLNPDKSGKLLLIRRTEKGSLTDQSFLGNWELPGGGVDESENAPYDHITMEALRELIEETGIDLTRSVGEVLPLYTALFKGPRGYDLAGVIPIFAAEEPIEGVAHCWVSTEELNQLAREFLSPKDAKEQGLPEAQGLLSGFGKRMHFMALSALMHSENPEFITQAMATLEEVIE